MCRFVNNWNKHANMGYFINLLPRVRVRMAVSIGADLKAIFINYLYSYFYRDFSEKTFLSTPIDTNRHQSTPILFEPFIGVIFLLQRII